MCIYSRDKYFEGKKEFRISILQEKKLYKDYDFSKKAILDTYRRTRPADWDTFDSPSCWYWATVPCSQFGQRRFRTLSTFLCIFELTLSFAVFRQIDCSNFFLQNNIIFSVVINITRMYVVNTSKSQQSLFFNQKLCYIFKFFAYSKIYSWITTDFYN